MVPVDLFLYFSGDCIIQVDFKVIHDFRLIGCNDCSVYTYHLRGYFSQSLTDTEILFMELDKNALLVSYDTYKKLQYKY